jgi:hypothetical protein
MSVEETSPTTGALALALSKAQGLIEGAKKDRLNPHFRSSYADLASVWDACREPLSKNEIAVVQTTRPSDAGVIVVTTLMHSSGEWIRGELFLPVTKNDAQGYGSALTYARRYGLAAIVGVAPEDGDAEGAVRGGKAPEAPGSQPRNVTADTVRLIGAIRAELRMARTGAAFKAIKQRMEDNRAHGLLTETDFQALVAEYSAALEAAKPKTIKEAS